MKKILSVVLAALMLLSVASFTSCGETKVEELKLGMGVSASFGDVTNADGETNGKGEVIATVAAVLVDSEGKIVKCEIDTTDNTVEYTSAGVAVAGEFATKYELGDNYYMAAYGTDINGDGKVLEWYAQADAFETACVGKTIEEVKALVGESGYYGTEELATAGCTIGVIDFVLAVEKAVANATVTTTADALSVAIVTAQSTKDASADANGENELEINFAAAAKKDGKVSAMATDVLAVTFAFDATGASVTDTAAALNTKGELGDNYYMAAYGADLNGDGKVLEWYAQADAFEAACVGLDADGIAALVVNGYGVESLQSAGCTIGVSDLVAVAVKAAK